MRLLDLRGALHVFQTNSLRFLAIFLFLISEGGGGGEEEGEGEGEGKEKIQKRKDSSGFLRDLLPIDGITSCSGVALLLPFGFFQSTRSC